jgi:hypothetical protein
MSIFRPDPAIRTELSGIAGSEYAVGDESKKVVTAGEWRSAKECARG